MIDFYHGQKCFTDNSLSLKLKLGISCLQLIFFTFYIDWNVNFAMFTISFKFCYFCNICNEVEKKRIIELFTRYIMTNM